MSNFVLYICIVSKKGDFEWFEFRDADWVFIKNDNLHLYSLVNTVLKPLFFGWSHHIYVFHVHIPGIVLKIDFLTAVPVSILLF